MPGKTAHSGPNAPITGIPDAISGFLEHLLESAPHFNLNGLGHRVARRSED